MSYPHTKPAAYSKPWSTLGCGGGDGYNELRIEDKKGEEQIYLHAQRDLGRKHRERPEDPRPA